MRCQYARMCQQLVTARCTVSCMCWSLLQSMLCCAHHGPSFGPVGCLHLYQAENQLQHGVRIGRFGAGTADKKKGEDAPLLKICHDASKATAEQIKGLANQVVKRLLFNQHMLPVLGGGGPVSVNGAVASGAGAVSAPVAEGMVQDTAPMEV